MLFPLGKETLEDRENDRVVDTGAEEWGHDASVKADDALILKYSSASL